MAFVNMETDVTLDMPNKFALIAIVMFFPVKIDTREIVNGIRNTIGANLLHIVNSSM